MQNGLVVSSGDVIRQTAEAVRMFKRVLWGAILTIIFTGAICSGASIYILTRAAKSMEKTEWISSINSAVSKGKLVLCPGGGICAYIGKKAVRLDE